MTKRYSYLESLNAGRERRPDRSYDDLNRALDSLESTFESFAGKRGGESRHGDADRWRSERRDREHERPASPDRGGFDLSGLARDIERSRVQEDSLSSITRIAADLTALRRDLRGEMTHALGGQFDSLRKDIETLYRSALNGRSDPGVTEELQRISAAIARLSDQRDDRTLNALLGEMDVLKRAVGEIAQDDTLRDLGRRWDEFGNRFETVERHLHDMPGARALGELDSRISDIAEAIGRLPDSLPIRSLEEKIRTLAGAIDHFSRVQDTPSPRSIEAIEERLDEIARAIVATSTAVHAPQFSPEPFERIEARISSLARQIDEFASTRANDDAPKAFALLADRIERLSENASAPQQAIDRLTDQIGRIAHMLDAAAPADNTAALRAFEQRFETLAESLQQQQDNTVRQGIGQVRAIEQRIEEMIERFETPQPASDTGIEHRLTELSQRMSELNRGVSPDAMRALVSRLDDISGRLDTARGPAQAIDPDLVRNLETQVAGLSALLSRPDQGGALPEEVAVRLDRLENAVAINRESVLDAARLAAEEAIRIAPGNPNGPAILALADDLKTLDSLARRSDERNTKTFEAIHETLLKIVDRLVMLENSKPATVAAPVVAPPTIQPAPAPKIAIDPSPSLEHEPVAQDLPPQPRPGVRQPARAARTPAEAASEAAFAAIEGNSRTAAAPAAEPKKSLLGGIAKALGGVKKGKAKSEPVAISPAAAAAEAALAGELDPALANRPIEPGSGAPDLNAIMRRVREEQKAPGSADAGQSDFIAAARRHAQAAAAEAETLKKKAVSPKSKSSSLMDMVAQKRKPILMAIGAIIIALSGLQLTKSMLSDSAQDEVAQVAEAPAPAIAPDAPAAKPVESSVAAPDSQVREATPVAEQPVGPAAPETAAAPVKPAEPAAPIEASAPVTELPSAAGPGAPPADAGPFALVEAAKGGDANAIFEIATRYADGRNGKQDLAAAASWFEKAADLGLAPAQYRIGNLFEKGTGVERDIAKAKTWYQMAAEQGNASAMHNLAVLYATGADGAADNDSAARWFIAAAELGVKDSQFNLGILAAKGIGMAQNLEESYKWFALAAKSGDKDAAAKRDEVAKALRPEQLEKARGATELWQPKPLDAKANVVDVLPAWTDGEGQTAGIDMKKAIKNIQLILNKNGYDAGSPDGMMGEKTKRAIAAFQKANGMPETGEVDEALVKSLLQKK